MTTRFWLISALFVAFFGTGCRHDAADLPTPENPCDTTAVSFSTEILPLVDLKCGPACHGTNAPNGGIVLRTYADIKAAAENGKLYDSIMGANGLSRMPPTGNLLPCDVDKIQSWIQAGTPDN